MERFAQLLLSDDAPIVDIADRIGIHNIKNLSRQFKMLKGVSPIAYRKQYRMMSHGVE
jgi:LacI family transcriptional regulator